MTTNKLNFNALMAGEDGGMKRDKPEPKKDITDTALYRNAKTYSVDVDNALIRQGGDA